MAQYLDSIDKFFYPRSTRFPEQFMDDVKALVGMATSEIIEQFSQVYVYVFAFVPSTYCMIQACLAFIFRFASLSYVYFMKKVLYVFSSFITRKDMKDVSILIKNCMEFYFHFEYARVSSRVLPWIRFFCSEY